MLKVLDAGVLRSAILSGDPYDHLLVENAIQVHTRSGLARDLPDITRTGSFPVKGLACGAEFQRLIVDLRGTEFRKIVESKFGLDLASCESVTTVRGWCGAGDGRIHTDVARKVVTVLIYLNPEWSHVTGRLRLLRSPDLNDYAVEIEPSMGSLVIFRRSEHSWHGHTRHDGRRVSVQHNFLAPRAHRLRSRLAALIRA